ncbi:DUF421 domain-containing protein [Pontibacter diazotrophicus]|uniref:DUF421 domain-containing protein n=1 Tax=Pontibacter diazotrophicus TaxID=1400979 RepID=A0A3D8L5F5_9BACT|nr:YetF domain-containing protein [Pontibacter diazotrophicus]RDV12639.1 DUF421 domain-containing protein [Pontibacter diazotrophicus]
MEKENIELGDWERILIGNNPWGFMLEVFFRTLIIYVCLIIVMRLLGKRMNAQLTITDLAVMLTLGAIASVPMQSFDKGILPGVILLIAILLLHQGLTYLTSKNRSVEVLTQGKVTLLAKEGVIDPEELQRLRISKDQVFAILRSQGIRHLGQVKRLYSEADGHFSVYKLDEAKPGLSVFPRSENALPPEKKEVHKQQACCYCGNVVEKSNNTTLACSNCGNEEWIPAIR